MSWQTLHVLREQLLSVGDSAENPPSFGDQASGRDLEARGDCVRHRPVAHVVVARELELYGGVVVAQGRVDQNVALRVVVAYVALACL